MIIVCPSCQSRFLVPAAQFATGPRMVRCARCSHLWMAEPLAEEHKESAKEVARDSLPAENISAENMKAVPTFQPAATKSTKSSWRSDWLLAGIALVLAVAMLWLALDRRDIARRWPSMEAFYDSIGLHIYHAGEGLSLLQVRSEMRWEGGTMQLAVEGKIHNKTDKPQLIPDLMAEAMGPDGKIMQSWQIDAPKATLAPNEDAPFQSEIRAPKGTVVNVNLHFVESSDAS